MHIGLKRQFLYFFFCHLGRWILNSSSFLFSYVVFYSFILQKGFSIILYAGDAAENKRQKSLPLWNLYSSQGGMGNKYK